MAKTIKFNLIIDKQPIRNLEDLQNSFNIEDLLTVFHNGSLKRWLEARELKDELEKLEKITKDSDDEKVASELCKIFKKDFTKEQIAFVAYPFEIRKKEEERLRTYNELAKKKNDIIFDYHTEYENLLKEIENKSSDYPLVKTSIQQIYKNYRGLFMLDAIAFYERFASEHKLVILAILANENMRPLLPYDLSKIYNDVGKNATSLVSSGKYDVASFMEKWKIDNNQPEVKLCKNVNAMSGLKQEEFLVVSCDQNKDIVGKVLILKNAVSWAPFHYVMASDLKINSNISPVKVCAKNTGGMFDYPEPANKKCLIIKMEEGNIVGNNRAAGTEGTDLDANGVNGKFPILDGIMYKSTNANHKLVYMEI
ncbi:hypothetical protein AGMMS49587_19000 [Spirochaetia bacterium]|nr:hypothetical protein AGMMS49587_19000 [Spirochaetia bacterium]